MTELVRHHWLLMTVFSLIVFAAAFWFGSEAPVARRVFKQFIIYIALPLAIILGTPLLVLALFTDLANGLWQAIIAGVVIATGWLTSAIFNELGKAQDRAERLRDYHKAIFAEIRNALSVIYDEGEAEADAAGIIERMEADPSFVPLIPREHHDFIYNAIVDEIEVLPRVTIDAIVAYYSLIKTLSALADDMRGERFQNLEQARRILMYQDYFETRKRAFALGQYALRLIKEFSEKGAAATARLSEQLNIPGAAPTGQLPESE